MSIVLKTLNTLEPRELFMIDNDFAIYIGPDNNGHMFANLSNWQLDYFRGFQGTHVVSYGTEWFLDVQNVTFIGNTTVTDVVQEGVYIGETGPFIRVKDNQGNLNLDAATAQPALPPHKLARAGNWRIWASRDDWASPNGSPIIIANAPISEGEFK